MKRCLLLAGVAISLGGALTAEAATIGGTPPAACSQGTLESYIDGTNTGCILGVLIFNNFSLNSGVTTGTLDANHIEVTPFVSSNGLGGSFGFSAVSGSTFQINSGTASYYITYDFIIDPGPDMPGADLSLDPGNVQITDFFCNDQFLINAGPNPSCESFPRNVDSGPVITNPQSLTVTTDLPTNSILFNPPAMNSGGIETAILLDATSGTPANFNSTTSNFDVENTTPEPAGFLLALGGMVGIEIRRRAFSQR